MERMNSRAEKRIRKYGDMQAHEWEQDLRERRKAQARIEKKESMKEKIGLAQRKCIQPLHQLEKNLTNAKSAKVQDFTKIQQAEQKLIEGLDKAAADSLARIMAEIKQICLGKQGIGQKELQQVELSVEDFYLHFKDVCDKFEYSVSDEEFEKIVSAYINQNFERVQHVGELVGYQKPSEQIQENVKILKNVVILENDLSV